MWEVRKWQISGGFAETMGQYNRRSCCTSSKVPQIPVILHLRTRATPFVTCCLRAYLLLGSTRAKMLERKV